MFEQFFLKKLQGKVVQYFAAHPSVKVVAVTGSIGKSTSSRALAQVFSQAFRVRMSERHHKDPRFVALELLGIELPSHPGVFDWVAALRAASQRVRADADVDVIIQEINTSRPGDLAVIGSYLHPDMTLLAGISPEQIDTFGTIEALGQEYMSVTAFSKYVLINRDQVDSKLAQFEQNANFSTYGTTGSAEYRFEIQEFSVLDGYQGSFIGPNRQPAEATVHAVGEHMLQAAVGAYAAVVRTGMTDEQIVEGISKIKPLPGRMNPMRGIDGTTIIDDTHDARPASVSAALQTLYTTDTENVPQRIAIIGDIQNLGNLTKEEHEKLGAFCDPSLLTWVVTVGHETEMYLAPAARARGCQVHSVRNAIEAGEFVRSVTETGAMILVTGAAGLYLEEAVKTLCDMSEDAELVRQTPEMIAMKNAYFSLFA